MSPSAASTPAVATARLGVVLALTAEAMFFLGIFGVVLVLRTGAASPPSPPPLPGGGWLLSCAILAVIANAGPLSLWERVRVRVISGEETAAAAPNHPHPSRLPEGEGTRRIAWATVVLIGLFYLFNDRRTLHWPADPSPLPCAVAVLAWALAVHLLISLLFTLGQLITPRAAHSASVVPLWFFALGIWTAERLLL